jgi:uncharacterized protein (DUF433 family)
MIGMGQLFTRWTKSNVLLQWLEGSSGPGLKSLFDILSGMGIDDFSADSFLMTTASTDIGTLVTRTPGLHGGSPHIAGKGITVRRVVTWYKRGLNAEEISDLIGNLTLAEVYAALASYHANKTEVETDLAMQAAEAKRLEALHVGEPQSDHE